MRRPGVRTLVWLSGAAAIGVGGYLGGRLSADRAAATPARVAPVAVAETDRGGDRAPPSPPGRVLSPSPAPASPPAPALPSQQSQEEARLSRAEYLIGRVFTRLDAYSRANLGFSAESAAANVQPYLTGLIEGAVQSDPQMRGAFSAYFEKTLCEGDPGEARTISLAHLAALLPGAPSGRGFDCVFSRAKEDVALWSMLDAWRTTGLEKTPALAKLQASATDARTKRRFLSDEEQMRERRLPEE